MVENNGVNGILFGRLHGNPIPIPADTTAGLGILEAFGSWLEMKLTYVLKITHL